MIENTHRLIFHDEGEESEDQFFREAREREESVDEYEQHLRDIADEEVYFKKIESEHDI